jgi:hypothetical protein
MGSQQAKITLSVSVINQEFAVALAIVNVFLVGVKKSHK